ncbi:class II aldolase/adducin family protein [Paludibaculum fermentans]|uniref:Class II aldolase/adducin family protein n=1 Tax=Paludibaculum fermentans TaxID=1473598 RepID=A0A7S7SPW2_PALFE|nr:class II aldolase/adducin family protein [Paludibaculum fermentans]QOY91585.1 class II aldolase/adducin family protein [Paludibaculum fermentans]
MLKTEQELREDIVQIGRLVFEKGWIAANDGNISIRLDSGRVLCTPTNISKGMLAKDDLIICDMAGNKLSGAKAPTSELAMHLLIYEMRPDIQAVVHTHPPVSTGFAATGRALNQAILPEVVIGLGCVPLAEYGLPGTSALTEPLKPYIPRYDAILMANHGVVCYGPDVFSAYFRMETVEHYARIALVAELLGGAKALPRIEVDKLYESRTRYGVNARSTLEAGCPLAAEDIPSGSPVRSNGKFEVTREELIALVEEVLRSRGVA